VKDSFESTSLSAARYENVKAEVYGISIGITQNRGDAARTFGLSQ
jgi:hypothetical protein